MTVIIYLHGFRSTHTSSSKYQKIRTSTGINAMMCNYQPHKPKDLIKNVLDPILCRFPHDEILWIGTSLGAFNAMVLSELSNSKFIAINPSISPSSTIPIGKFKSHDGTQDVIVTKEDIDEFARLENNLNRPFGAFVLGKDDKVIDLPKVREFIGNQELYEFDGQGHRFRNIELIAPVINNVINHMII